MIKKLLLLLLLIISVNAYELNIKAFSVVGHKFKIKGLDWNEGFDNKAKGIELICNNGLGITYINFYNSFGVKTIAKGLVYKANYEISDNFGVNAKGYFLKQKGYYEWQVLKSFDNAYNNEFYTPMASIGANYKGFTADGLVLKDTLSAFTFGYKWEF